MSHFVIPHKFLHSIVGVRHRRARVDLPDDGITQDTRRRRRRRGRLWLGEVRGARRGRGHFRGRPGRGTPHGERDPQSEKPVTKSETVYEVPMFSEETCT